MPTHHLQSKFSPRAIHGKCALPVRTGLPKCDRDLLPTKGLAPRLSKHNPTGVAISTQACLAIPKIIGKSRKREVGILRFNYFLNDVRVILARAFGELKEIIACLIALQN